jgi:malate synthase
VTNARYAVNAANARLVSLYDALYGTDAIPEDGGATRGPGYNRTRGAHVVAKARQVLDQAVPLALGSHQEVIRYQLDGGRLSATLKVICGPRSAAGPVRQRGRYRKPEHAAA